MNKEERKEARSEPSHWMEMGLQGQWVVFNMEEGGIYLENKGKLQ